MTDDINTVCRWCLRECEASTGAATSPLTTSHSQHSRVSQSVGSWMFLNVKNKLKSQLLCLNNKNNSKNKNKNYNSSLVIHLKSISMNLRWCMNKLQSRTPVTLSWTYVVGPRCRRTRLIGPDQPPVPRRLAQDQPVTTHTAQQEVNQALYFLFQVLIYIMYA